MAEKAEVVKPLSLAEKMKGMIQVGKNMDKKFDTKTLIRMGDRVGVPVPVIPTGLALFDYEALGTGGFIKGRVIEIFGPESAGKTTIALNEIGEVQKAGGTVAFVDAEHALDPTWANKLGV